MDVGIDNLYQTTFMLMKYSCIKNMVRISYMQLMVRTC